MNKKREVRELRKELKRQKSIGEWQVSCSSQMLDYLLSNDDILNLTEKTKDASGNMVMTAMLSSKNLLLDLVEKERTGNGELDLTLLMLKMNEARINTLMDVCKLEMRGNILTKMQTEKNANFCKSYIERCSEVE